MNQDRLIEVVKNDASLFNAKFYGYADVVMNHVNEHHLDSGEEPVTMEEAQAALDAIKKAKSA